MLRNTATRLCLYQTAGGPYRTTTCDRSPQSATHGPGPVSCPALQVADAVEEFGAAIAREGGEARVVGAGVAQGGEGDVRQLVFVRPAQPHRLVVVPTSDNVAGAVMSSRPAAWSSPTPSTTRAVVSRPRRPGSAGRPCTGELGQRWRSSSAQFRYWSSTTRLSPRATVWSSWAHTVASAARPAGLPSTGEGVADVGDGVRLAQRVGVESGGVEPLRSPPPSLPVQQAQRFGEVRPVHIRMGCCPAGDGRGRDAYGLGDGPLHVLLPYGDALRPVGGAVVNDVVDGQAGGPVPGRGHRTRAGRPERRPTTSPTPCPPARTPAAATPARPQRCGPEHPGCARPNPRTPPGSTRTSKASVACVGQVRPDGCTERGPLRPPGDRPWDSWHVHRAGSQVNRPRSGPEGGGCPRRGRVPRASVWSAVAGLSRREPGSPRCRGGRRPCPCTWWSRRRTSG